MPPERHLLDAMPGETPSHEDTQQLIEAEQGLGVQGIHRVWLASDSVRATTTDPGRVVLISDTAGVKISRDNGATPPAQVIVDGTQAGGGLAGTYPNPTLAVNAVDALIPPGTVWAYAGGPLPPPGWLVCNGAVVARATYPKLAAAIAGVYGAADASTFTLPDLRGRVVLGVASGIPLGQRAGSGVLPDHGHVQTQHTHGSAALGINGDVTGAVDTPVRVTPLGSGGQSVSSDNHTHNDTLDVSGTTDLSVGASTGALTNLTLPSLPPYVAMDFIIRTGLPG